MKPEIAKLWIKALRSKKYTQTQGRLRRLPLPSLSTGGFCCMGVLCDLYTKETGKGTWEGDHFYAVPRDKPESTVLPRQVMNWAGMHSAVGKLAKGGMKSLVAMNDGGCTFREITKVIEEYTETL